MALLAAPRGSGPACALRGEIGDGTVVGGMGRLGVAVSLARMCSRQRSPNRRALLRACGRSLSARPEIAVALPQSLEGAYAWLCRAQDATPDDGVAGWYHLVRGWSPSYPETTGYLIPTFLTYARVKSQPEARARALRMADWEIEVQLPSGAARSGVLDTRVEPAVFNTGQVLFGWIAAYQVTRDERYARAARRAAEWLCRGQDADGAWRKDLSVLASSTVQTYNVRAAWGLALAGQVLDEPRLIRAARKNCDWALRQQQPNGWFRHNRFTDREVPSLHTIAYTLEGLLGMGELVGDQWYVDAARAGIEPLADEYGRFGRLRGRYDGHWHGTVSWRCLTGEAQLALVLARLAKHAGGGATLTPTARALLEDVARTQDLNGLHPESRGGISGSEPVWGGYTPLAYVSWGAKFQIDALLLCLFGADVHGPSALEASGVVR